MEYIKILFDIFVFLTIRFFVCNIYKDKTRNNFRFNWPNISFSEIHKGKYNTDYPNQINNWESASFLNDNAKNREDILLSKLANILTVLSILMALFSLDGGGFTSGFPHWVRLLCLAFSLTGIIYGLEPLFGWSLIVPDFDKINADNTFTEEIAKDFQKSVEDYYRRYDFVADCLKVASTCIIFSILFFIVGLFIGYRIDSVSAKKPDSIWQETPARNDSTKGPFIRLFQEKIIWLPREDSNCNETTLR
jgi:hypothetical protein